MSSAEIEARKLKDTARFYVRKAENMELEARVIRDFAMELDKAGDTILQAMERDKVRVK